MSSRSPLSRSLVTGALLLATLSVSACGLSDFDPFGQKEKVLPGERIAVLANERSLSTDVAPGSEGVLLPAPTSNPEWPMAGGYANHAMHHIAINANIEEVWSRDIGAGADDDVRFNSTPIVADGMIFAMDTDSEVSAYMVQDGDKVWG